MLEYYIATNQERNSERGLVRLQVLPVDSRVCFSSSLPHKYSELQREAERTRWLRKGAGISEEQPDEKHCITVNIAKKNCLLKSIYSV